MTRRKDLATRYGPIKRLHVDQAVIKRNRKEGRNAPAITVQTSAGPIKVRSVTIRGIAQLIQAKKPLACGARVYIETRATVVLR